MRKLTCRDVGGVCDAEFVAETFMEMGKLSQAHVMEQVRNGDVAHMAAVQKMMQATPEQQREWMAAWQELFASAPEL